MLKRVAKSSILRGLARKLGSALSAPKEFGDVKVIDMIADAVLRLSEERNFSDAQRYELFYTIGRKLQPDFPINDRGRYLLADKKFRETFERTLGSGNWKNFERRWNLGQMLRLVGPVAGDLAECGVFEGASARQLCEFATEHGRRVHLFDSFQGLSAPAGNDGKFWAEGDLSASEEKVRENLGEFDCFDTFPGWIPDAFEQVADRKYAFVHIDVDLEQSTFDSIAFFYPRLSAGGVMLLDDHGYDTCPGARKAALDFMANKLEPVLDLSTGQGLIVKI
ncbi:MAG: TylF/MycF/NovP-related O-methyltransferase [Pseudomonadota bacterium]